MNKFSEKFGNYKLVLAVRNLASFGNWMCKFGKYSFQVLGKSNLGIINPWNKVGVFGRSDPRSCSFDKFSPYVLST